MCGTDAPQAAAREDGARPKDPPALRAAALWALNPIHLLVLGALAHTSWRVARYVARRGMLALLARSRRFWAGAAVYLAWMVVDSTHRRGGWGQGVARVLRRLPVWKLLARYFPLQLRKTTELDPSRPYIVCCHPHGIIGFGTWLNFGMHATVKGDVFPGVNLHCLGASAWFYIPLLREFALAHAMGSVEKETVVTILGRGDSVAINLGGAREALDASAGRYVLHLGRRKGFVRCALETGASLVPVMSFGENEVFSVHVAPAGSLVRRLQDGLTSLSGSTIPIFHGLPYAPLLPKRSPIVTVVGEPIEVPLKPDYTPEDVDTIHATYVEAVVRLFEDHKAAAGFSQLTLAIV